MVIDTKFASDDELKDHLAHLFRQHPERAFILSRIDKIYARAGMPMSDEDTSKMSRDQIASILEAERSGSLTDEQLTTVTRLRMAGLLPLRREDLNKLVEETATQYRSIEGTRGHFGFEALILLVLLALTPPAVLLGVGAAFFWVMRGFTV